MDTSSADAVAGPSRSQSSHPQMRDTLDHPPQSQSQSQAQPRQTDLERVLTGHCSLHPEIEQELQRPLAPELGPPPDGGREAWCVVASTTFVLFCVHGLAYYLTHQLASYSRTSVAWISSVQLTLTFAFSILGGRYFDAHGTRLLVRLGFLCSIGALLGLAFCSEYNQFMLAHTLFAISGSILYTPATAVVGQWFLRRRGTATGCVSAGVGLGGVIYPIMLNRLFEQIGFRNTVLALAGMNAVLMTPALFFLKARLPPRRPPPLSALKRPFRDVRYTMALVGSCVVMLNWFSPYFNAPLLLSGSPLGAYSITLVQTGSLLGRILCGPLADALGVWRVFISASSAAGIVVLALWTPAHVSGIAPSIVGLIAYGIASGAWMTLVPPAIAAISPVHELGMRTGMLWSASFAGLLAGPVICGHNTFRYAGIFCGITLILGSGLTISPRAIELIRAHVHPDGRKRMPPSQEHQQAEAEYNLGMNAAMDPTAAPHSESTTRAHSVVSVVKDTERV